MSRTHAIRVAAGFVALNLLVAFPLLWIVGSYVPDRLDLSVSSANGDGRLMSFRAGVDSDGTGRGTRLKNFGLHGVQRMMMYFNSGCRADSLEFGFGNGPASFSIDKMTMMHRCLLIRELHAERFAAAYEVVGDARVSVNGRGGLDVELLGDKVVFRPRDDAASAWRLTWGSGYWLLVLFVMVELGLLLFSLFVGGIGDADSFCAVAAKSATVAFAAVLLFVFALPLQTYLANRSSFPFQIESILPWLAVRGAVSWIVLTAALCALHFTFSYLPHVVLLAVVAYEYLVSGVMSIGLPPLNGELVWWVDLYGRAAAESAVGVVIVAAAVIFRRFVARRMYAVSAAVVLMIAASMADLRVEKRIDLDGEYLCSHEDIVRSAEYSSRRNIFVFVLDAAPAFSCARELAENPELRDMFPGFVQFGNNLAMGDETSIGLPGLMTGRYQGREEDGFRYAYSFFETNSLAMTAAAAGVPTYFIPGLGTKGMCSRIIAHSRRSDPRIAEDAFDARLSECMGMNLDEIVRFCAAPLILKVWHVRRWWSGMDWTPGCCEESVLYPCLEKAAISRDMPLTLHVYHTIGMHVPISIDRNGSAMAHPDDTPEGLRNISYAKLHEVGRLFAEYRRRGIYDNSLIVVCGDHGHVAEPLERRVGREPVPTKAFSLLMVKPVGANEPFTYDDSTPTSHCAIKRLVDAEVKNGPLGREKILSMLTESGRVFRAKDREWQVNDLLTDSSCRKWR